MSCLLSRIVVLEYTSCYKPYDYQIFSSAFTTRKENIYIVDYSNEGDSFSTWSKGSISCFSAAADCVFLEKDSLITLSRKCLPVSLITLSPKYWQDSLINRYLNRNNYRMLLKKIAKQLLFITRMPKLCAILQLVSAPSPQSVHRTPSPRSVHMYRTA